MLKSEAYHLAQIAVLYTDWPEEKTLEVLSVLMEDEKMAKYGEKAIAKAGEGA